MPLSLVAVKMSPGYLIDIDTLYSMVEVGRGLLTLQLQWELMGKRISFKST